MLGSPTVPPGPNSERTTRTCSGYASAARAAYLEVRAAAKQYGEANGHYPAATAAFYNVGLLPVNLFFRDPDEPEELWPWSKLAFYFGLLVLGGWLFVSMA